MARPLKETYFGTGDEAISVRFHNGTEVVNGHIVKQIGSRRFRVSDGVVEKDCVLADTTEVAEALTDLFCTLTVETQTGDEFVKRILGNKVVTTEGQVIIWPEHVVDVGRGKVLRIGEVEEEPDPDPFTGEVLIDFKNGVYMIGGVLKTREEVVIEDADWFNAFDPADIEPGVGLVSTGATGPTLTAEASATLAADGCIAVITFRILDPDELGNAIELVRYDAPDYISYEDILIDYRFPPKLRAGVVSTGSPAALEVDPTPVYKAAARFHNVQVWCAMNGEGPSQAPSGVTDTPNKISMTAYMNGTGEAIIERVEFYLSDDYDTVEFRDLTIV